MMQTATMVEALLHRAVEAPLAEALREALPLTEAVQEVALTQAMTATTNYSKINPLKLLPL